MGFQRRKEDFVCAHCGTAVEGNGYTNHCPKCLWSKHVDVMPGDRADTCGGLMRPIRIEGATPEYIIIHKCERCGAERRVRTVGEDSPDALIALARLRE
jgi:DNA-directed RNA polymerase subunit RPC12/RpoP